MAKKAKEQTKEIIPEGMSKKDYADKAFRKKVTIINSCILLAFIIGVVAVIGVGWYNTNQEEKRIEAIESAYKAERDAVIKKLQEIEMNGGSHEDKKAVKIEVTDENFNYWLADLDASYQAFPEDDIYAQFGGAEIHLQGMFVTREYSVQTQYWVYRNHTHGEKGHDHEHDHEIDEGESNEPNIAEMIPIEVIFADKDTPIPEDGTWVDVRGVVGPDSTKGLSAVREAVITIMDEPGQEYIE